MRGNIMNRDNTIGLGIGLLAGVIIGATIALLYAPKSGKETRQLIKNKVEEVIDSAKEKTSGVIDTVKEVASEANRKGRAAVQALKS
jgi:gas vesicle protein